MGVTVQPQEQPSRHSAPVEGFSLAYDHRPGDGGAVVMLHGWPGDRTDWRRVLALLPEHVETVVPDLRGFGGSDKHESAPDGAYDAAAQARSVAALVEELGLDRPVVAGYDIGSRTAQTLAAQRPDLVRSLVLSPPLPGAGARVLDPEVVQELWYYGFHRSGVAARVLDGDPGRVRAYLRDRWERWSAPGCTLADDDLEHLVEVYGAPGAFAASIAWYCAGAGLVGNAVAERAPRPDERLQVPVRVLWPEHDPVFRRAFADRLDEFFGDVSLTWADGAGHFTPLEAPGPMARLIAEAVAG